MLEVAYERDAGGRITKKEETFESVAAVNTHDDLILEYLEAREYWQRHVGPRCDKVGDHDGNTPNSIDRQFPSIQDVMG